MVTTAASFQHFDYMRWAKAQAGRGSINLAKSGLGPPSAELLPLRPMELDLAQRGYDMPPGPRARLASRYAVPDEQLMLALGTSQAMFLATRVTLAAGERALVETPSYQLLHQLPGLVGAESIPFSRRMQDGYRLPADLPAQVRALRPRMVVLSNPHNPSGALLSREELRPTAEAVAEVGGLLLVDEVYMEFVDDPVAQSALHLGPQVAVASSFTKAFGLGTVRFGWLVGSGALIEQALRFNDYLGVLYPNPSAWVGDAALDHQQALRQRAQDTREAGLAVLSEWLHNRADGKVRWHPSEAGVMALLELPAVSDVDSWCEQLLSEQDTVVVPGRFFAAPRCIRVGFAVPPDMVAAGLAAIERML